MADSPDIKLRISADLRRKLDEARKESARTLNAEIIVRLEASFGTKVKSSTSDLLRRLAELEATRDHVFTFSLVAEKPKEFLVKRDDKDKWMRKEGVRFEISPDGKSITFWLTEAQAKARGLI